MEVWLCRLHVLSTCMQACVQGLRGNAGIACSAAVPGHAGQRSLSPNLTPNPPPPCPAARVNKVQEQFGNAMGADDFMQRVEMALYAFGFNGDNSIGALGGWLGAAC